MYKNCLTECTEYTEKYKTHYKAASSSAMSHMV